MVINEFSIIVAKIVSVEKGNVLTNANPVIAFTVNEVVNDKPVKCIVKGDLAVTIWNNFMAEGKSRDTVVADKTTRTEIRKEVFVSFKAALKEERKSEVVLENPSNFSFSFVYNVA